jgi:hypothetical protein
LAKSKAQLVNPKVSMSALLNENIPDYCMVNTLGQQLDLHIYEQHQLSMLKYWTDPPKTDVQRVFMLEKGLEAHFVAPEHAEVIVFNKIPVFSAFKKICQSLAFI